MSGSAHATGQDLGHGEGGTRAARGVITRK